MRLIVGSFLVISSAWLNADELTIGTFNCEFLNQAKVHIKYGHSLEIEDDGLTKNWHWLSNNSSD